MTDDAFHQPFVGLFADLDVGVGSVRLVDEISAAPHSVQLKVLSDWQRGITREYNLALARFFQHATRDLGDAELPDKMRYFTSLCAQRGIACTPDFVVMLQQI